MVASKELRGFSRSVHKVGVLKDGTLYADLHVFDGDLGEYACTYYVAPSDAKVVRQRLQTLGFTVATDEQLVATLAELVDTAYDMEATLRALGGPSREVFDDGARCSVLEETVH